MLEQLTPEAAAAEIHHPIREQTMEPEIRELDDGSLGYFYSLQQMEYYYDHVLKINRWGTRPYPVNFVGKG